MAELIGTFTIIIFSAIGLIVVVKWIVEGW